MPADNPQHWTIAQADARHLPFADGVAQCCVTSPPYYGLRDYGVSGQLGLEQRPDCYGLATGQPCGECYVCQTVLWAREVWRVLRDDGVLFLNIGDSYAGNGGTPPQLREDKPPSIERGPTEGLHGDLFGEARRGNRRIAGYKQKDLLGIPWAVAFALRADGWYLRSDVIWAKPNPMPESVTDRPTKAHEYIFILAKQARYFWDSEAVKENANENSGWARQRQSGIDTWKYNDTDERKIQTGQTIESSTFGEFGRRNIRTVWTIPPQPYAGAHFATMPPELARRCIRAGSSVKGQCPHCGKAWVRVVERSGLAYSDNGNRKRAHAPGAETSPNSVFSTGKIAGSITTGWRQSCSCPTHEPIPQIVLDPFTGSGTTGMVARQEGRHFIGTELNAEYIKLAQDRIAHAFRPTKHVTPQDNGELTLWK